MRISARVAGTGFSLVLAIVGVLAAIVGSGYGFLDEEGAVGPGFLPVVFGAALALLAVVDTAQRLLSRAPRDTVADLVEDGAAPAADEVRRNEAGEEVDIFGRTQRQRTRILVAVILGLIATVLLTALVGFIIAFTLLMLGIAILLERRPVLPSVIISVVAGGVIWALFTQFLLVPLPTGLLGWI